ncbi:hypothetical protein SB778_11615, partial [Paraburkholderia sp. SIMBA_050]
MTAARLCLKQNSYLAPNRDNICLVENNLGNGNAAVAASRLLKYSPTEAAFLHLRGSRHKVYRI